MDPFKRNRIIGLTLGFVVLVTVLMGVVAILYFFKEDSLTPIERAKVILDEAPLVDGNNNLAYNIRKLVFNDLRKVDFSDNLSDSEPWKSEETSQTDIPKLRAGFVGVQIWAARVDCDSQYKDAVAITLEQIDVIKRFIESYSDHFMLVTSLEEIEKARDEGKIASLISVEGGHSIQSSLSVLRQYYDLGVRILTLAHTCSTPWIDYSRADHTNKSLRILSYSHGISVFGEEVIKEMNRLGMIIDLTHSSVAAMIDVMNASKAPVIFSHSSARSLCDTDSNVSDVILKKAKQKDSLVMVSFDSNQIKCDNSDAEIEDVIQHIEYIKNKCTMDNVGIGSNFDAIKRPVKGLEDPSKFPDLFAAMIKSGNWHYADLKKLAGRNFLRVLDEVEKIKDELKDSEPIQVFLNRSEVRKHWDKGNCTSSSAFPDPMPTLSSMFNFPRDIFG